MVNYKSFGFTKFVPRLSDDKFAAVVKLSGSSKALELWENASSLTYVSVFKGFDHDYS